MGDLVSQFSMGKGNLVTFNLGSRYDLQSNQLENVNTELAWQATPLWRLEWRSGYNGTDKQFLYNEYLVTRDLHCWATALYVSTNPQGVGLFLNLKALNTALPSFGIGRGGQVLNTSQGTPL